MSRIGTVLLFAVSLAVGGVAQASVPDASVDEMLTKTVELQLSSYRAILSTMDRDNAQWRSQEPTATHLDTADDLLDEAQTLHLAGDDMGAGKALGKAWGEIAPVAKTWIGRASPKGQRSLVRTLSDNTADRISMMRSFEDELPAQAIEAIDRAQTAHSDARGQRESDPAKAIASECAAIQALNKGFQMVMRDANS